MRVPNRLQFRKQGFCSVEKLAVAFLLAAIGPGTLPAIAEPENMLMVSVAPVAKHSNLKTVKAQVLIQAPPALVWDMLTDYPGVSEILPGYERTRVLSRSGSTTLMDVGMRVSNLLPLYKYRVRAQENEADRQLSMTRIAGDFKSLQASYKLTPQNHGKATLLSYQLSIDPGVSLPGSTGLIRNNTLKSLNALERHAELAFRKGEIGQR